MYETRYMDKQYPIHGISQVMGQAIPSDYMVRVRKK